MSDPIDRMDVLARIESGDLGVDDGLRLLMQAGSAPEASSPDALRAAVERHVAALVAEEAQVPLDTVLPHTMLDDVGFDSVMAVNLVRALSADFGDLPATLLFEHRTIASIAERLAGERRAAAVALLNPSPTLRSEAPWSRSAWSPSPRSDEPVAVVGVSGRFPEADDIDEFWTNLTSGRDSIVEIPAERWNHDEYFAPEPGTPGKSYTRWGGFLRDIDRFDAEFFNISPREAERMDPQERLFLEQAYSALEDSGSTKASRQGRPTGVYVGVMYSQYQLLQAEQALLGNPLHLGASYASIANRVSYLLDLSGPSFAVDSMCSSSLTALHLARQALVRGDVDLAVAGGVNINVHPAKYVDLSQGRYASTDGRCRSFGEGGDGYVPGEGVGAVVLKRLADAEADGDQIYGLISGSALGHGGRTNGYTVPNPGRQSEVIRAAMQVAGVDPAQVSYIEAHGTGTALGDPNEIASLTEVLNGAPRSGGACAVGSVKSNIGHLEGAAGIAGLIKVLLQLRHRELAPSLHAERLNPNLDLDPGVLTVQRTRAPWPAPADGHRIAGLSSFGAGGANAHVVVEEYRRAEVEAEADGGPHVLVLSARSTDRLRALVASTAREATLHQHDPAWIAAACHTSRVGRDVWEERLAVVASDAADMAEKLREYERTGRGVAVFSGRVELGHHAAEAAPSGDVRDLARAWVHGDAVRWPTPTPAPRKVWLPSAPLVRVRHWPDLVGRCDVWSDNVHLTRQDPLVRDHIVSGRHLLSAAAVLELVRAAAARAGLDRPRLEGVTFESPVVVPTGGCSLRLTVDRGTSRFTVTGGDEVVHARGRLARGSATAPARIDVPDPEGIAGDECYRRLARRGLRYGPRARVLTEVGVVDGRAVGRLSSDGTDDGFRPLLLDGAFHALIAFASPSYRPDVPVAVESVEMFAARLPDDCRVCVAPRDVPGERGARLFDVAITDTAGAPVLVLTGLVVDEMPSGAGPVVLRPTWQEAPIPAGTVAGGTLVVLGDLTVDPAAECDVVRCRPGSSFQEVAPGRYELDPTDPEQYRELLSRVPGPGVVVVDAWQSSGLADPRSSSLALCRAVATAPRGHVERVLHVAQGAEPAPEHEAVAALLRTLQVETGTGYRVVHAHPVVDLPPVLRDEVALADGCGSVVHGSDGTRREAVLVETEAPAAPQSPYRRGGTYLITGGAGGLGRALALHLARTAAARIVLTGRRPADAETDALVAEVQAAGGAAIYLRADVADPGDVGRLVDEAREAFGALHGVFHLAGVVKDGLLGRKRAETAAQVWSPKIDGLRNLDAATVPDGLELFVSFSSAASVFGIAGQGDYAYANAYLNHFTQARARQRPGRTVSVAWPLWEGGGMDVSSQAKERIATELGWIPLPADVGLDLLDALIGVDGPVHAVFYGDRRLILNAVETAPPPAGPTPAVCAPGEPVEVPGRLRAHVRGIVADELKMPDVDPSARFEQLGLESVMVMNVTRRLARTFAEVTTALFFEFRTVNEVCAHLAQAYPDVVRDRFDEPDGQRRTLAAAAPVPAPAAPVPAVVEARTSPLRRADDAADDPIAVVGLSGRYPMAPTLGQLWSNLVQGRDCITEVPAGRWDHDRWFDPTPGARGKTYSRWGGFLDGFDEFDPLFFAISPREAASLDPQERLFLETAWHAVEDAGYTRDELSRRSVGVFAGVMYGQYELYGADANRFADGFVPSSVAASVANRVSYALDLHGPSLAVNTMCSSSLTALHLACSAIRVGDCDEAIVGGVNTIPHPYRYLQLSQGRFASTDGRCRAFGAGGDGYVPGEGVGAVVLKRLSRAVADGDHVYGLIRGSSVNHGGRSNGYTVPDPAAQAAVVEQALRRSGLTADRVGYIEAHGTGTSLGDPIEIAGLARVFADVPGAVPIGSIKSNIGHLEAAAGIAALTKVLLQLRHGRLVPSLHADEPNPHIDFSRVPFIVQRETADWDARPDVGRVAAISSFGAGGSNAHLLVEEHVQAPVPADPGDAHVAVLSARTAELLRTTAQELVDALPEMPTDVPCAPVAEVVALVAGVVGVDAADLDPDDDLLSLGLDAVTLQAVSDELAGRFAVRLGPHELAERGTVRRIVQGVPSQGNGRNASVTGPSLRDVAFTLAVGREPRAHRVAIVAGDVGELRARLTDFVEGRSSDGIFRGQVADDTGEKVANLLAGAHGDAFIQAVRAAGDLERLAALWAAGVDVRPSQTGPFAAARRLSLPGSPMNRERFWVPEPRAAQTHRPAAHSERGGVGRIPVVAAAQAPPVRTSRDEDEVRAEVVAVMSSVLEVPRSEFDLDLAHADLGVDSVLAVDIVDRLNERLGTGLKPTDFFNYSTLRRLVDHIVTDCPVAERAPAPASAPARASTPERSKEVHPDDIAVIGMSGTFPGARDLGELWARLRTGSDLVGEIPPDRWDVTRHFDADASAPGKTYSKWGSVLAEVDRFDPDFFGISPREARLMDPQQRLYLMEAWRALEDAGYSDEALDGLSCHAYVGVSKGDYDQLLRQHGVPIEGHTFTGTNPAVLASRLAYHLNLTGASLAVDTSCSSSLMAVHLACEALRSGQAHLAVAGGVAALSTPELHILASKAGMLSPTGRCRPFDDGADGFVPGEGVGVVVLKRLSDALRDGDQVHAVVVGSGANQDGRTNGLTAPNANAQAALQRDVHRRFGIDPVDIGYVECHGTGTRLGDPIEVEALTAVFGAHLAPGSCALGSVKSNLGHTLTAAGVAGLLKAVLCLEHQTLVPTAHVRTVNRYIPFDDGPFYVPTETVPWPEPGGGLRHAAVNAFGFSGTNVHVVVRQAPARVGAPLVRDGTARAFPVSAPTREGLRRRLADLVAWLDRCGAEHDVRDLARTLGQGRSHFAERAVFVAVDAAELRERIESGDAGIEGREGAWVDAARDYLAGGRVDWRTLSAADGGRTVSMPAYPFADERYWVPGVELPSRTPTVAALPPSPDAGRRSRVVHVEPTDPVVADHVVDGKPLLPAAGHISFVHHALADLFGTAEITLRRIVWLKPVFVSRGRDLRIVVTGRDDGWTTFEVRSTDDDGAEHPYSRGEARPGVDTSPDLRLDDVRGRCRREVPTPEHYARFDRIGVLYGAEFATVTGIRCSETEVLADLEQNEAQPLIPAGVLDGAIQSVASLHPETEGQRPQVPFAMDRVRLLRAVPVRCHAHVGQTRPGECTITITDLDGRACAVIEGMAYRELKEQVAVRYFVPAWTSAPEPAGSAAPKTVLVVGPRNAGATASAIAAAHRGARVEVVTVPNDDPDLLVRQVGALEVPDRIYLLGETDAVAEFDALGALERAQETGVRSLLRLVRHLVERGAAETSLDLFVVTVNAMDVDRDEYVAPRSASLAGMVRSLAKEQPRWRVGLLDVRGSESGDDRVIEAIVAGPGQGTAGEVAVRSGKRWMRALREVHLTAPSAAPYRDRGVYVILGGAGGIGAVLAKHLAASVGATVVLLGRRVRDDAVDALLVEVGRVGGRVEYHSVDAADEAAMVAVLRAIRDRHGAVHGVFHSALVLRDSLLERMPDADLDAVLEPKVRGAVALARAIRTALDTTTLDVVVFFSSALSLSGNVGQGNYAAACTFKDAFATRLAQEGVPVKVVNWGYWGEVGVVAEPRYRRRMQAVGVHSIGPTDGMAALDAVINGAAPQVAVLKADDKALTMFGVTASAVAESWPALALPPGPGGDRLLAAHTRLDAAGTALLMRAVQALGAFRRPGVEEPEAALVGRFGIAPAHERLWATLLDMLVDAGYLERHAGRLTATAMVTAAAKRDLDAELAAVAREQPEVATHAELLGTCLRRYPAVLTGQVDATEVMFPGSSVSEVEKVYRGDPLADRLNEIVAAAVIERIRSGGRTLRIVEIGAGTGGTSASVLAALDAAGRPVEYVYTDVSAGFLRHGRRRFGERHEFVRFERLDIERPVGPQGHDEASCDVVVAANVLHATADLRLAVEHAASLLKPGGWLVLSETTSFSGFATLTFGLLDGWWRWTDPDLRIPGSPLADVATWRTVLRGAGFSRIAVVPPAVPSNGDIGQNVLVAEFEDRTHVPVPIPTTAAAVPRTDTGPAVGSVRQALAETVAESLGRAEADLDPDRPFTEYGVDSIILVELVGAINARLGIELRTTALFDHPTLNELAAHVEERRGGAGRRGGCRDRPLAPARPGRDLSRRPSSAVGANMAQDMRTVLELVERGLITPEEGQRRVRALRVRPTPPPSGSTAGRVAVVGLSARYAGAADADALWRLLVGGRSGVREVPVGRWDGRGFYDPDPRAPGRTNCVRGGFVDGVDLFDPLFFNLSGREAEAMDPQQRLFLEGSWNALEDAGYAGDAVSGIDCGVYVGAPSSDYATESERCGDGSDAQVLMGNDSAILAARISYLLNLRGPSMSLNTACSSSLVAVHLAAKAIVSGECEMALAGGVCLFVSPGFYIAASTADMLSPDGECFTFDERANGFVPGEGVGVVVLKDLDAALRDGDSIRGVILGSAINQDGKTNGITAPSSQAQSSVQLAAYRAAGVTPDGIGMVEAHGTGTALGDPVEIDALTRSFGVRNPDAPRCVVGSIKTNIGHTGQAAGVAGLIKVLLSFEHEVIPPSLNFERANPRIDFDDSPFRVASRATNWPASPEQARRAAVSSFGYSGTNAHIVVEEGPGTGARTDDDEERLVLVSAKTKKALRTRLRDLADWADTKGASASLADVAFTLHVGRKHFSHRWAVVARSTTHLGSLLRAAAHEETEAPPADPSTSAGRVNRDLATVERGGPEWGGALRRAAAAYRSGTAIDARLLYPHLRGHRVPLPTYPYERERYWTRPLDRPTRDSAGLTLSRSSDDEFCYRPSPTDPLVAHHVVASTPIVAAMLSVEMMAAAVEAAGHGTVTGLTDLSWRRPLRPLGAEGVGVRVTPSDLGHEVCLDVGDGAAVTATASVGSDSGAVASLDLDRLRERLTDVVDGEECRRRLRDLGVEHGEAYRVLTEVRVGVREALARLETRDTSEYRFHPLLLDGALQAMVGLTTHSPGAPRSLPRALDEIRRYGPLPPTCVAHLRLRADDVLDIDIADDRGTVLVALRGLRVAEAPVTSVTMLTPVWRPVASAGDVPASGPVLVLDDDEGLASAVRRRLPHGQVVLARAADQFEQVTGSEFRVRPGEGDDIRALAARCHGIRPELVIVNWAAEDADGHRSTLHTLVAVAQALSGQRARGPICVRFVVTGDTSGWAPSAAGTSAAARTLRREDPDLLVEVIGLATDPARHLDVLLAAPSASRPVELLVDASGQAQARDFVEAAPPRSETTVHPTGCYVISGGAGAVGRAIGGWLAAAGGTVVLLGRRSAADVLLGPVDPRIEYRQTDVTDRVGLSRALDEIRDRFGPVRGIVHAAGVLRDAFVRDKPGHDIDAVLASKVTGARLLDELTAMDPVDFMVLCSSAVAVVGNPGQIDYAYANGYLDGFAAERAARGRRTVSLGWPAWSGEGMASAAHFDDYAITAREGLACFEAALGTDEPQLLVLKVDPRDVPALVGRPEPTTESVHAPIEEQGGRAVHRRAQDLLIRVLAEELRVPVERIDPAEPLEAYGIDSVMVMRLSRRLEEVFGTLPKTLFFEYRTLTEASEYFAERHADRLIDAGDGRAVARPAEPEPEPEEAASRWRGTFSPGDIAVIGIAGRYPLAADLDEYWDNLVNGRDCITEIPPERWPLHGFFGERGQPGRSYSKWGGFLSDVDAFDPVFFGIAPREADMMDPQERLFLEVAWNTLEDAGYPPSALRGGPTGVFVGVMYGHYQLNGPAPDGRMPVSSFASIANRVSYLFDLHGPSLAVDTMCSSALTAIHLAVAALRRGECDTALAGGVNLSLHPDKYRQLSLGGFAASDGRCRSFGEGGDGYVPGEGVGAVLLKPLDRAVADGDHVHAVLRGSAVNHGGKTHGYTVPNPAAQADVIRSAMTEAGVSSADIDYVEAHGTGTALGDPIEIRALGRAYGGATDRTIPVGSAKSVIGHLESAAGIAALTKVVLQFRHRTLPPTLHANTLNPDLDLEAGALRIHREVAPWAPASDRDMLTAAISSFGAGGANAHLVVSEPPPAPARSAGEGPWVLVLSAKSDDALRQLAERLAVLLDPRSGSLREVTSDDVLRRVGSLLGLRDGDLGPRDLLFDCGLDDVALATLGEELAVTFDLPREDLDLPAELDTVADVVDWLIRCYEPELRAFFGVRGDRPTEAPSLADTAYTLQVGREAMPHRLAVVASTHDEASAQLRAFANTGRAAHHGRVEGSERPEAVVDGDVHATAHAWVSGVPVKWGRPEGEGRRIPLVLYPFARERHWLKGAERPTADVGRSAPSAPAALGPTASTDLVTRVEDIVRKLAGELIGLDPGRFEPTSSLGDYGFDSITMKALGDRIANRFGVDFSPTVFFERSGVRGAASWLVEEYGAGLAAVVDPARVAVASPGGATRVVPAPVVEPSGDVEPIAVIGMSCRFPGAPDVETFWANLCERRDLVTEIPPERWDWRALDDPGLPPERRCQFKWGAFLDGVDEFDPLFFGISPAEAEMMDPQQRLLLQTAWAAFEDAGYRPSSFAGHPVGLFAGIQFNDYQHLLHEAGVLNAQAALGNEHSIAVNRISYLLDLHGPSEPVNTACSSSLVAVHRAVQSLRRGESTLALAGGVALNLSSHSTVAAGMMGLLSPDGRCKTLDSGANGYVKGEGVGLLLLKPLSRALRDRDHIHAVIRGTAVNHGGRAASLTAPNSAAQSDVVRAAVADAGVDPETIGYLELHGTGTELGDPIEIDGLNRAFRALRAENHLGAPDAPYCGIGSVKTNIGHLEPASGIAGLIKVIQSAKHRKLPGMAHLTELNPYVRLDGSPFYVVEETQQWSPAAADGGLVPLRAGVSSFGFGGVNAHVVIEEHPVVPVFAASGREHVFVLSARTAEAVTEQAVRLVERINTWLATDAVPDPAAVAATLQHGREEFAHRAAVVATGIEDLRRKLTGIIEAESLPDVHRGRAEEGVSPEGDSPLDMARGWVRGAPIQWPEGPQVKVSLPTYPFARTRHWFTASRTPEGGRESGPTGTDVAAEQRVRGALRAILMEKLKLSESELEDDRDLKELGVDSILSAMITTLVQQHFGVQVSVTALAEHPTVADLAEHILHDLLGGQVTAVGAVDVLPSAGPSSTATSYPPELIPINTTGDGQASFWVHGAAGYAAWFDSLSRALGPEYPLYAFQAKGTDGFSMPHLLDEMADHYVECIRLVQPHGPYVIGGYSFGGLVAMEMARRLQRDGETVRHLIMFDTYPATQEVFDRHEGIYDADFLTYYLINYLLRIDENPERAIRPAELEHLPASLREQALSKLAKERGDKRISTEDIYLYLRGGLNCSAHAEGIYQTFEMRPYDASDVLFFKATDGFTGKASAAYWKSVRILDGYDYLSPWRQIVEGAFDVVELDNDHLNLLAAPTLHEAARRIVDVLRMPPEFDPDEYARFRRDFDAVTACGHDLLAATLGASIDGDGTTRADLAATLGVGDHRARRRLLDACIDILEREGYVDEYDGRLRRTAKAEKVRPEAVQAEAALAADRVEAATDYVPLLVAAQRDLSAVLSGEKQGTDVLMPGGSTHLVAELYKNNVQTEFYNRLVADHVAERAGRHVRRFPRSTVQVFEVGAGTGGTSEFVFDALGSIGHSSRYFFTDIGAAFVEDARRRFSDGVPGAEFCVFDIERAVEEQGIEPHSMDVVVASNVLHATRDIRTTLANCARMLKPSGVLIINELTRRLDYNTLTFGLTDGWWLFEDEDVRIPGSPLLAVATWKRMLREAGLSDIDIYGVPGVQEEEQAQCVVVARHEPKARVQ